MKDIIFKTLMLKGEAGSTIVSMEKTGHSGTTDTYTITFDDGSTTEIQLENMSSIESIELSSQTDTEDIYTVTMADGSTQHFSVQNHIADMQALTAELEAGLSDIAGNLADQAALLNARMDTFTSLPSESTAGDAELMDIRDGADGKTYDSAGSAVRGQANWLKSAIDYEKKVLGEPDDYKTTNMINENALIQSKMIADDGSIANAPNNTWYVTDFLDVGHENTLYLKYESTTSNLLFCYDEDQNPIGSRIAASSDRVTLNSSHYIVSLYPHTRYVRANVRTAWLGRYMLTKYFYPSSYVAAGTYANRTPKTVAAKAETMFRNEAGIVRTYFASWNAQLTNGKFSLLDMPQNTIAYVATSEMIAAEIAGLPFTTTACYIEKVGRGSYNIYKLYDNNRARMAVGFNVSGQFYWYGHSNFVPVTIGMLGDSVTEGRIGGTSSITDRGIPYWVGYETGLPVINLGVGNMGWASHQYLETNAYEYLQTLDLSGYDVLTLQYGLNDGDIPLGTYTDTTQETIMGYVYKCLDYIYSQNSSVQVIIINPTVGSKPASFPYFNPNGQHSASDHWTFTQYFEQMKLFCDKYAIPLIDSWKGLNAWNRNTLIGDNVHPTYAGYKVIGRYIAGQIKSMI